MGFIGNRKIVRRSSGQAVLSCGHSVADVPGRGLLFCDACERLRSAPPRPETPKFTTPILGGSICMDCDGCGWTEGGSAMQTQCTSCGGSGIVPDPQPPQLGAGDVEALRAMFAAGIKTACDYGDNVHHCEGEQRERAFQRALARLQGGSR